MRIIVVSMAIVVKIYWLKMSEAAERQSNGSDSIGLKAFVRTQKWNEMKKKKNNNNHIIRFDAFYKIAVYCNIAALSTDDDDDDDRRLRRRP